ncbi:hypothetical protein [Gordonia hankookensis]
MAQITVGYERPKPAIAADWAWSKAPLPADIPETGSAEQAI